ncbi:hypothetical protein OE749_05705 [Aestuariibacter sp. AA17]|uniref:Uncharacterized protein n=1 Tax=Fluctibacter corallii TaxID=2984329 RepID=A0ABT3A7D4_9ALTE|nr:hypothetical protein [Aestuariibacter sp. AA17]MCV2884182.1 hypothetical protein [Aestuariibacter sp. AA17]
MKTLLLWTGVITLAVSLSHGFITDQSIVHSLLLHPLIILLSFVFIAIGLGEWDFNKTTKQ